MTEFLGAVFLMNENAEGHGISFELFPNDALRCTVYITGAGIGENLVTAPWVIVTGQWQHVVCQRTGNALRLYVDGSIRGEAPILTTVDGTSNATLGSRGGKPAFEGLLGPVRFSRVARYGSEFEPRTRWAADSDTILLYLVDQKLQYGVVPDEAGGDNPVMIRGGIEEGGEDTPCEAFGR